MQPTTALGKIRLALHHQLHPEAWTGKGMSPVNWTIFALIWISIFFGVIATETSVATLLDGKLGPIERIILGIFLVEYAGPSLDGGFAFKICRRPRPFPLRYKTCINC